MSLFGILLVYYVEVYSKKKRVKNKIPKFFFSINHRSLEKKLKFSREQKKKKKNTSSLSSFSRTVTKGMRSPKQKLPKVATSLRSGPRNHLSNINTLKQQ